MSNFPLLDKYKFDYLDLKIIYSLLQEDGQSMTGLSKNVGLAQKNLLRRVEKLEEQVFLTRTKFEKGKERKVRIIFSHSVATLLRTLHILGSEKELNTRRKAYNGL